MKKYVKKDTKVCKKCGTKVSDKFVFCPFCGTEEFMSVSEISLISKIKKDLKVFKEIGYGVISGDSFYYNNKMERQLLAETNRPKLILNPDLTYGEHVKDCDEMRWIMEYALHCVKNDNIYYYITNSDWSAYWIYFTVLYKIDNKFYEVYDLNLDIKDVSEEVFDIMFRHKNFIMSKNTFDMIMQKIKNDKAKIKNIEKNIKKLEKKIFQEKETENKEE